MAQGEGGGRPIKCTPKVCRAYLQAIAFGLSYQSACAEAGICESTLDNWRKRGATGEEPYAKFLADEKKALAAWERDRQIAMDAAGPQWTREAWRLERRMPDDYGKRERHEVTGKDGGPIETEQNVNVNIPGAGSGKILAILDEVGALEREESEGTGDAAPDEVHPARADG